VPLVDSFLSMEMACHIYDKKLEHVDAH